MHSPATGKIVSELVLGTSSSFEDAPMLRAERFAEGNLLEETALL
jgi:glycine/D-amino acid oxidase-like deaminating enzyme